MAQLCQAFRFCKRTPCDHAELYILTPMISRVSFRNVRGYRSGCATKLTRKSISLRRREFGCNSIDIESQIESKLPDSQTFEWRTHDYDPAIAPGPLSGINKIRSLAYSGYPDSVSPYPFIPLSPYPVVLPSSPSSMRRATIDARVFTPKRRYSRRTCVATVHGLMCSARRQSPLWETPARRATRFHAGEDSTGCAWAASTRRRQSPSSTCPHPRMTGSGC